MAQWSSNLEMVKEESDSGDDQNGTGKDVLTSVYLSAANGLYHLYSQALHFQKAAFDAGQKHALGKLCHWVQVKMQEGRLVTLADIYTYLQEELNKSEPPTSQLWDIGSNWSGSLLHNRQETKPDASSSVDPVQAQWIDGNSYYGSQDLEMEITSEDASH